MTSPRSTRRYLCARALPLLAPATHPTPSLCPSPTQKRSLIPPAESKAPLGSWQSPMGACKLQQSVLEQRASIQTVFSSLSNLQWGLYCPLHLLQMQTNLNAAD